MPYASTSDLPGTVKSALPHHGQKIYQKAFNAAHEEYGGNESKAHATAWAAVKNKYKKRNGKWAAKDAADVADAFPVTHAHLSDIAVIDEKPERTADGYMKAFARVARTGIQTYKGAELGRPELDEVRVYRPPNEVFAGDAMRSLAHRPLTLHHPRENVGATNWRHYAVGYTGEDVVRDGDHVRVPLMLCDGAAISAAMHDGIKQLSVGYSADIAWHPGRTPDGEKYDAVQSGIKANHVAIVPEARGGSNLDLVGDQTMGLEEKTCPECQQDVNVDEIACPNCGHLFNEMDQQLSVRVKPVGRISQDSALGDQEEMADKEFSTKKRKALAKEGKALAGGGFPIESKADLANAIQAFGRAKNPAAAKAHIIKRARALGATADLPEDWKIGDSTMRLMIEGVPVNFEDEAGASYMAQMIDKLKKQLADARRDAKRDQKGPDYSAKEIKQEAGGGQVEDQDEGDDDDDGDDDEEEARRKKQTGEDRKDRKDRKDRRDARDGEIAALKKRLKDAVAASSPEAIDLRAQQRQALLDTALPMLGDGYNHKSRTDLEIMRDAVAAANIPDADKMAEAEINGAFRALAATAAATTPFGRMVDGLSSGVRMSEALLRSDRDAYNVASNNGPRNGVHSPRGMSLHDAKAMRDAAYNDKLRYLNTAWQGNRGYDPHGRNSNDFGRS